MPIRLSNIRKTQDTAIGADGLDSAQVTTIASGVGIQSFDTLDSLPISSLTAGDRAFVKANKRLYISNGSGWYNVALVNLTPTMSLSPSGTITLSTDGTASTVTITASDSDGVDANLTFSVESDGNMVGTGTTVTQDSSVFTITPLTADSGGVAGDFTLTFKTSDAINVASSSTSFSLVFSTIVDSSAPTTALIKATGNGVHNTAITYQDASDASTGFTENDYPAAGTFSPYRSGGYSYFNDATNTNWLEYANSTDFQMTITDDWTIEAWVYPTEVGINNYIVSQGTSPRTSAFGITTSNTLGFQIYDGSNKVLYYSTGTISKYEWTHVALTHQTTGATTGTLRYYINGVEDGSFSVTGGWGWYNGSAFTTGMNVGRYCYSNIAHTNGYIRDLRIVNGTRVYTGAFTPPTEQLTAITNTALLTCNSPNFNDRSSSAHAVTVNGYPDTKPFGPRDYSPWTADAVGGSVYFDGSNDYLTAADDASLEISNSNFTIELWVYKTSSATGGIIQKRSTGWANGDWVLLADYTAGQFEFWNRDYNSGAAMLKGGTVALNTWHHVAVTRSGNTWTMWVDGTSIQSVTSSHTVADGSGPVTLGRDNYGSGRYYFNGYLADVRINVGTAIYSSSFTPPTAPLSHVTNTKLLMNNKSDANVRDLSASAAVANASQSGNILSSTSQRQFDTSSSYDFTTGGGGSRSFKLPRGSFDTRPFVGGPFTVEFWVYPSGSWTTADSLFTIGWKSGGGNYGAILFYSNNPIVMYASNNGSSWNALSNVSTGISHWTGSWKHIAFCKYSDGNYAVYLDGTRTAYGSAGDLDNLDDNSLFTNTNADTSFVLNGTVTSAEHAVDGYFQDLRLSAVARYTGTSFTPPAAEFSL